MVLADTNVIIDYWKMPDDRMTEIFNNEDIAVCGIVEAELIHGARSEKEIESIKEAISCFEMLSYSCNWEKLGRMLNKLRTAGVTLPFTDAMIAQIAIDNGVDVLTKDNHFKLIQTVLPELKLYVI
ncbi:MAG: PIN domain-containing protein [Eubacterium sp.]|nr:PIN domain-containing protein [Eubacterium sp.]